MPARCLIASYSAREANGLPQTCPHRALWGHSDLLEEEGSSQMKMTPDKVVVQFFPGNILANSWWVNSHSTLPTRQGVIATLWNEFIPE